MICINNKIRSEQFVIIFRTLKDFSSDILLRFEDDRLYVQGMDNAHVSLFEVVLSNTWFDEYNLKKPIVYGINTELFNKILSTKKPNHSIVLDCSNETTLKITLVERNDNSPVKNKEKEKEYKKTFNLQVMDLDVETLGIPNNEEVEENCIEFKTKHLKSILDDIAIFGDTIKLKCNEDAIKISCKNELCSTETTVDIDQIGSYNFNESSCSSFNIYYLQLFLKFYKLSEYVWIHFSEDFPLQIKYNLENTLTTPPTTTTSKSSVDKHDDGDDEGDDECDDDEELDTYSNNYVRFYVAPKALDDDDDDDDEN